MGMLICTIEILNIILLYGCLAILKYLSNFRISGYSRAAQIEYSPTPTVHNEEVKITKARRVTGLFPQSHTLTVEEYERLSGYITSAPAYPALPQSKNMKD